MLPIQNVVDVGPGVYTFYRNGSAIPDAATTDAGAFWYASLTASFQPN